MLTKKQLLEIREHLERAQNPVFFFDNDVDGICSYIILRRFLGRGKGVAVKSHPFIDRIYARKIQEFGADYVFILDRHDLGKEFVQEVKNLGLPIIWIDHHDFEFENYDYKNLFVFNPTKNKKKSSEPTTYLCYKAVERKEDLWVALIGCIADHYLPNFAADFGKIYPEYWSNKIKEPFDALYGTGIGRLAKALSFGIKDSVTHVVQLQNFLINCKSPNDIESELESNSALGKKYREIIKKYELLLDKAKNNILNGLIFFNYGGDLSISSDISNQLSYLHPDKIICVAYTAGPFTNISLRGKNVKKMLEKIIAGFEGATGGGHDEAVGARINSRDLERFKEQLSKMI